MLTAACSGHVSPLRLVLWPVYNKVHLCDLGTMQGVLGRSVQPGVRPAGTRQMAFLYMTAPAMRKVMAVVPQRTSLAAARAGAVQRLPVARVMAAAAPASATRKYQMPGQNVDQVTVHGSGQLNRWTVCTEVYCCSASQPGAPPAAWGQHNCDPCAYKTSPNWKPQGPGCLPAEMSVLVASRNAPARLHGGTR